MFSESRWKDSNRFYGTPENILFALAPRLKIYRASGGDSKAASNQPNANTSNNYQYLNMKSYGYPHGIGMGGNLDRFRFFIPEDLDDGSKTHKVCVANESDLTYEHGELIPSSGESVEFISNINDLGTRFNIECLEIWACGGEELIKRGVVAQAKDRDVRSDIINKARQCDKAAFAGNSFDQEFLLSKTFAHKTRMADDVDAT